MNTYYITFPGWSPGSDRYCIVKAPSKKVARVLAMEFYRTHWAFIYTEEDFDGQVEKYNLKPTRQSPISVGDAADWYEERADELLKEYFEKYRKT